MNVSVNLTLSGEFADLPEILNLLLRFGGGTAPLPMPAPEPDPNAGPASAASPLAATFRSEGMVNLRPEQAPPLMAGLGINARDALRRIIDAGSPVFSPTLLIPPGEPQSYPAVNAAITKRLRSVTGNPDARLFGWDTDRETDPASGFMMPKRAAMSEATFQALRGYFESAGR
jgi:hypothetical protein